MRRKLSYWAVLMVLLLPAVSDASNLQHCKKLLRNARAESCGRSRRSLVMQDALDGADASGVEGYRERSKRQSKPVKSNIGLPPIPSVQRGLSQSQTLPEESGRDLGLNLNTAELREFYFEINRRTSRRVTDKELQDWWANASKCCMNLNGCLAKKEFNLDC